MVAPAVAVEAVGALVYHAADELHRTNGVLYVGALGGSPDRNLRGRPGSGRSRPARY